jgi:diaminopimelate decarboxylase
LSAVVLHGKKIQPHPLSFPPPLLPPHPFKEGREGRREGGMTHHLSTLWGPTCDGLDCVDKMTRLPELEVGGWVAFLNVGALPSLMRGRTCFNGLEGPTALHCFTSH